MTIAQFHGAGELLLQDVGQYLTKNATKREHCE